MQENKNNSFVSRIRSDKSSLWKNKSPLLSHLDIELTERCNNDCIHCYINLPANDVEVKKKELSFIKIEELLKEAASLGCLRVRFTGGEPLLRDDFEEIYLSARRLGMRVILFTNSTLITPQLVKLFSRIPPLKKIEVSLYGMTKESYEAVTRKAGSFEAAWRGINLLLENNIPFIVKGSFLAPNKSELETFESWTDTILWMDKRPSYSLFLNLRSRKNSQAKNEQIKHLRMTPEEAQKILVRNRNNYIADRKEFCSKFMGEPGGNLFSCGAGLGSGCIDAYGNFKLCMLLSHPKTLYNLKNGSLKESLVNFFPAVRKIKASNPEYLRRCSRCFIYGLCEQCPAKSWLEYGTLDTPVEYTCEVAHYQARDLGLLQAEEKAWEVRDPKERLNNLTRT